jgi:single-strand DNA-binding protein
MANLNLNKVIIGGRLTADAELKQTPSGVSVTAFSIAVNRKGKDAQTDFIDVVAWRQTAEFISKYFKKGSSICIVGSLQKREWTDKNNQKRYATEVIAEEASFVDSKNDSASSDQPTFNEASAPKYEEVAVDDDLPF